MNQLACVLVCISLFQYRGENINNDWINLTEHDSLCLQKSYCVIV